MREVYFCYFLFHVAHLFSELSLATTIAVLTPVSWYYMTSFNDGREKARNVGLTCRYHLSNIMPDSIFCDNIGWGMTQDFLNFFLRGGNCCCLPRHRRDGFSRITIK